MGFGTIQQELDAFTGRFTVSFIPEQLFVPDWLLPLVYISFRQGSVFCLFFTLVGINNIFYFLLPECLPFNYLI